MPVLKRRFFHHEKGNHDETFYYLARDTDTADVYVIHGWAARANVGERRVDLWDFLSGYSSGSYIGSAQKDLLELLGTLVTEENSSGD